MTRIEFTRDDNLIGEVVYQAGDVVELDDKEAEYHIDGGFAKPTNDEPRRALKVDAKSGKQAGAR
jgi:hypothetical protein